MGLAEFIIDIGRPVAYYPSLKRIALTTTASILLCQLLYWSDKTEDGWVEKNSEELESETGLTYEEQKTARAKLKELNLIDEVYMRSIYTMKYKINQKVLNERWEESGGKTTKPIKKPEQKKEKQIKIKSSEDWQKLEESYEPKKVEKKGDILDMYKDIIEHPENWTGLEKENKLNEIRSKFATRLHVNPDTQRWQSLINHAYTRHKHYNENVDKFIDWLIGQGYFKNVSYWPPNKMLELWPQAYIKIEDELINEVDAFLPKVPEVKEKKYAPMPNNIGKKKI